MSEKKPDSERVRDIAPLGIRLSAELKQRVSDAAKMSGKSMNSFVVELIETALPNDLSNERDLFLTKAAYHYSQSAIRWPEYQPEGDPRRIAAEQDQLVFKQYLFLRHPSIDAEAFLAEEIDPNAYGNLYVGEVDEQQKRIREFVAQHSSAD